MRFNRLMTSLMGVAGACVVGVPAKAIQLQSWQFDPSQNRLTFTTDSSVQPQAKLLSNPRRLVVELPGTSWIEDSESPLPTHQAGSDGVQQVRLEQSTAQTRLVLELSPDYEIAPQQIQVWGITSQQWVVQLPTTVGLGQRPTPLPPELRPASPLRPPGVPAVPTQHGVQLPTWEPAKAAAPLAARKQSQTASAGGITQLQGVLTMPNGFFIQTGGPAPQVQVYRVRDRNQSRQLVLDIVNAQLTSSLSARPLPSAQYGVNAWSLTQFGTHPPAVRIILSLAADAPDWQVAPIRQGGIVLLPVGPTGPATPPPVQTAQVLPVSLPPIAPTAASPPASLPAPSQAFPQAPLTLPLIGQPATAYPSSRPIPGQPVVVLDPGHGGADPGAVGINGIQEKQIVMAIARQVAAILQAQGIAVVLTRQGDEEIDLQPRVDTAEQANASLFVSIHANAISLDRPEVNGVETYYYSDLGARFAEVLHQRVLGSTGMGDRGVRQARFYVLRRTSMPAVLIETGFVTGVIDAPQLTNPVWQGRMSSAIAQGILDYLRQGSQLAP